MILFFSDNAILRRPIMKLTAILRSVKNLESIKMNLIIFETKITKSKSGMYRLNDFQDAAVASGRALRSTEIYAFMRRPETQLLIDAIQATSNQRSLNAVEIIGGKGKLQGTYVCKELVYSYAMWISPEFHLHVIRTFDKMVMDNATRKILKDEYIPMTEAIKESRLVQGKEIKHYHFSNEADMINRIVTGLSAKKYKEENETESVRDSLTPVEKLSMVDLQRANAVYIEEGLEYEERKEKLEARYQRRWLKKLTEENILLTA